MKIYYGYWSLLNSSNFKDGDDLFKQYNMFHFYRKSKEVAEINLMKDLWTTTALNRWPIHYR